MMLYYTGFQDFSHFQYFFSCLGPAAYELFYKSDRLLPEEELLLTLFKLRQGKDNIK